MKYRLKFSTMYRCGAVQWCVTIMQRDAVQEILWRFCAVQGYSWGRVGAGVGEKTPDYQILIFCQGREGGGSI